MRNARAKRCGLAEFRVDMDLVEVSRESSKDHNIRLGYRARSRDDTVTNLKFLKIHPALSGRQWTHQLLLLQKQPAGRSVGAILA